MAPDPDVLLTALQFGDSGFPAGGFAFSWGLEGLAADGLVEDAADVADIVREQLIYRWNSMDRILLRRACRAADLAALEVVDLQADQATLSASMRVGSRRAGRALLGTSTRLGHVEARDYRVAVAANPRLGHLPVAQALVFQAAGLPVAMVEALSGWGVISGLASAAVRLGLIGHIQAQEMTIALRPVLSRLLTQSVPEAAPLASFTPLTDIALARAASRHIRLFAT